MEDHRGPLVAFLHDHPTPPKRVQEPDQPPPVAASSSSLDTHELSFDPSRMMPSPLDEDLSPSVRFRHSFWQEQRARTFECLSTATYNPNRLTRFWRCGSRAWVQRSIEPVPRYRVVSARCNDRWCEACAREKRYKVARNLVARMPRARLRFVTLTLKTTTDDVGTSARRMIRSFRRLRQDRRLAGCFAGGAWFMEFTVHSPSGLLHPHLHILTQGEYLPQALLRLAWHKATGDSYIVDVREVKDPAIAAGYVVKYAGKLLSRQIVTHATLFTDAIRTLGKTKGWSVFGTWLKMKLATSEPDGTEWEYLEPFVEIWNRAAHGDELARQILGQLRSLRAVVDAPCPGPDDLLGPSP